MRRLLRASLLGLTLTAAAAGAEEIAPETDRMLWCASAFYWLAGSADDAGDAAEAELYDGWSLTLMEKAMAALEAAGSTPDEIEATLAAYIDAALEELDTDEARHDVFACPDLVEDP